MAALEAFPFRPFLVAERSRRPFPASVGPAMRVAITVHTCSVENMTDVNIIKYPGNIMYPLSEEAEEEWIISFVPAGQ